MNAEEARDMAIKSNLEFFKASIDKLAAAGKRSLGIKNLAWVEDWRKYFENEGFSIHREKDYVVINW